MRRRGDLHAASPPGSSIVGEHVAGGDVRVGEDVGWHCSPGRTGTRPASSSTTSSLRALRVHDEMASMTMSRCSSAGDVLERARIIDQVDAVDEGAEHAPVVAASARRSRRRRPTSRKTSNGQSAEWPVPFGSSTRPGERVLVDDVLAEREDGVVHGDVDELALAGAARAVDRRRRCRARPACRGRCRRRWRRPGSPSSPAGPVMPTMPPMLCAMTSNAGQSAYGLAPVRGSPKPRMAP